MNLMLSLVLAAQTPAQSETALAKAMEEQKMVSSTATQAASSTGSIIMITPKERADDLKKAFEFLRGEKSASKVLVTFKGDKKISNVIDMKMMPEKTIFIFRYSTPQGIKFQVAPIEDIVSIEHK